MKLKVISFNILCGNISNGHTIIERAPRLAEAITPYCADVMGLQEYTHRWEPHISKYFGDEYEIYNVYRDSVQLESTPILWRKDKFELIEKGCYWLSDTPEVMSMGWDELGYKRTCLYAILEDKETKQRFNFMNTHFGFGDDGQVKSAKLLIELAKKLSSYPTFVTGDFNAIPTAPAYSAMTEYFTDANAVTAKDFDATYHGFDPEQNKDEHIDYCFADSAITPVYQNVIRDTFEGKYPSDHYGIYTELEI